MILAALDYGTVAAFVASGLFSYEGPCIRHILVP
jgi:hypothetical protein